MLGVETAPAQRFCPVMLTLEHGTVQLPWAPGSTPADTKVESFLYQWSQGDVLRALSRLLGIASLAGPSLRSLLCLPRVALEHFPSLLMALPLVPGPP